MATPQAALRANQRLASSLESFNGKISVLLKPVPDEDALKFTANVTYETGDTNTPTITFSPCTDAGVVREFNDADDVITWLNGAFFDITEVKLQIDEFTAINKPFVPPTDAVKYATAQKARFTKLLAGMDARLVTAEAKVTSEVASGWNLPTAHPVLQANHAETVKQRDTVLAIKNFYQSEITRFNLIINPV